MSKPPKQTAKNGISDTAIQTHLNIIQGIITRMAANSANCKTWCITIVSAVLIFLIDKNKMQYNFLAYSPIVLFALLDCYYLGLEREFRTLYTNEVHRINSSSAPPGSLYEIRIQKGFCFKVKITLASLNSFSTSPIYLFMSALVAYGNCISTKTT